MGIKQLFNIIRDYAPGAIYPVNKNDFVNKKVGLDISIFAYACCTFASINLIEKEGLHLRVVNSWFSVFKELNTKIIVVFDGPPPVIKAETIEARRKHFIKYGLRRELKNNDAEESVNIEFNPLQELDKIKKLFGQVIDLVSDIAKTNKNIKLVIARGEADLLLARLVATNKINFVISNDSDILAHYAGYLNRAPRKYLLARNLSIRNVTRNGVHKGAVINGQFIDLKIVLDLLSLNAQQFIALCIMLGTDYSVRICGPQTALKLAHHFTKKKFVEFGAHCVPKKILEQENEIHKKIKKNMKHFIGAPIRK